MYDSLIIVSNAVLHQLDRRQILKLFSKVRTALPPLTKQLLIYESQE